MQQQHRDLTNSGLGQLESHRARKKCPTREREMETWKSCSKKSLKCSIKDNEREKGPQFQLDTVLSVLDTCQEMQWMDSYEKTVRNAAPPGTIAENASSVQAKAVPQVAATGINHDQKICKERGVSKPS